MSGSVVSNTEPIAGVQFILFANPDSKVRIVFFDLFGTNFHLKNLRMKFIDLIRMIIQFVEISSLGGS